MVVVEEEAVQSLDSQGLAPPLHTKLLSGPRRTLNDGPPQGCTVAHSPGRTVRVLDPVLLHKPTYCIRPELPQAGRLTHFLPFWEMITTDPWVLNVIRQGYSLELLRIPRFNGIHRTPVRDGGSALSDEVVDLCEKSAVRPIPLGQEREGFYSTYFIVPKKDGGLRPILNLKPFNLNVRKRTFKMETLQTIISIMTPNLWLTSVDLKDAYFHVAIVPAHRRYLRFHWKGQAYQYNVLPFGLSSAPRVFTQILMPVIAWLRARGVHIYAYLDDILVTGTSPLEVSRALSLSIRTLTAAGYVINVKKSDLSPSQDLVFIGGRFITPKGRVFLPEDRRRALIQCVRAFMQVGRSFPARAWLRLLGLLASTIPTVALARLHMKPVQWFVKFRWSARRGLRFPIMTKLELVPCLRWWAENYNLSQGVPFLPPPHELTVTTDSSMEGWGGHMLIHPGREALFSNDWSTQERKFHINLLELRAVRLTLQLLTSSVTNKVVRVECDNTTAVAYINKQGGTRSRALNQETRLLYNWAVANRVTLGAIHRPGVDNILADFLSRNRPDPLEWSLSPVICEKLFHLWNRPQIDLFASAHNHKLDLWFSGRNCPEATAVDAFAQSWTGWYVYAFPPFNLIRRTLLKIRSDQVEEAIVVLPNWPRRPWYPLLLEMTCTTPVRFHSRLDLLSQTLPARGTLYHPDLRAVNLTAWRLSAAIGRQRGSQPLSSIPHSQQGEPPQGPSTPPDGLLTVPGALSTTSIRFLSL